MLCERCETLPEVPSGAGTLYLWPPLGHTTGKIKQAFKHAKVGDTREDGGGWAANLTAETLPLLLADLSDRLTSAELQDTRCLFKAGGGSLDVADFGAVTTLSQLQARVRLTWLTDVLSEDRLVTFFQPIFSRENLFAPAAHECLLRFKDESGTLASPGRLFEAAREADYLFFLDRAAREVNVRTAAEKRITTDIFVNFTPTSIYDPTNCLRTTFRTIADTDLKPENIVFEVIETDRFDDVGHLRSILQYYQSNGFRVALDDLGSGYSSLNILSELKPDIVKLDRELVSSVHSDRFRAELVSRLISLAHQFGIKVVAEGIEEQAEAQWLLSQGVDYLQGFYFARPAAEPIHQLDRRGQVTPAAAAE